MSRKTAVGLAVLVLVYLGFVYLVPRPESVTPAGWRLTGIFLSMVAGLMLQPLPTGALVLMAVAFSTLIGGLTPAQALAGYGDPTAWLVQAAFFISRSLIDTGLARRIALVFVKRFGGNSTGVCYALCLSDMTLAPIIPSNGARSGGVILPIVRSIAELYGSKPGETARVLGAFLFASVYQGVCISSAMFYTGNASNPLAAQIGSQFGGVPVTFLSWMVAGSLPGLLSLLVMPLIVNRLYPPTVRRTPEASRFASDELQKMGPLSRDEWILTGVFVTVCGLWVTSGWHKLDVAITALLGACALLATGVLKWEKVVAERAAWDIFIWYGGLIQLGKSLNATGVTTVFANNIGGALGDLTWPVILGITLLIYFYAHYGFASITAHMLALYPPFLAVLAAKGAPVGLCVYAFACFTNMAAGLTHYGTTPGPMFYAQDYVSFRDWWRVGAVVSVSNILIWSTVGFLWWKFLGIW